MVHFLRIARICNGLFLSECKKFKYLAGKCDLATILWVLMKKRQFYNGENQKILKSHFCPEKCTNIVLDLEYIKSSVEYSSKISLMLSASSAPERQLL